MFYVLRGFFVFGILRGDSYAGVALVGPASVVLLVLVGPASVVPAGVGRSCIRGACWCRSVLPLWCLLMLDWSARLLNYSCWCPHRPVQHAQ